MFPFVRSRVLRYAADDGEQFVAVHIVLWRFCSFDHGMQRVRVCANVGCIDIFLCPFVLIVPWLLNLTWSYLYRLEFCN